MALPRNTLDIPLAHGLAENIDDKVLPNGALIEAENVRFTKQGSLRKRKGTEPVTGVDLPTDTEGATTIFEHKTNPNILSRKGLFTFSEAQNSWLPATVPNVAQLEIDQDSKIHNSNRLHSYDLAILGNYICEAWVVNDGSQFNVWYRIRDAINKAILQPPIELATTSEAPQVIIQDGGTRRFCILYLKTDTNELKAAEIDPTTSYAPSSTTTLQTGRYGYDCHAPTETEFFVVSRSSTNSTAIEKFNYNLVSQGSQSAPATLDCDELLAIYADAAQDKVWTVTSSSVNTNGVYGGFTDYAVVDTILDAGVIFPASSAVGAANGKATLLWDAAESRLVIAYSFQHQTVNAYGSGAYLGEREFAETHWGYFDASFASQSDTYMFPHMVLSSKFFKPDEIRFPVLALEFAYKLGNYFTFQTAALLVACDYDTTVDPSSATIAAYPVILARILDSESAGDVTSDLHLTRPKEHNSKWIFGSPVASKITYARRGFRHINRRPQPFTDIVSYSLNFDAGPASTTSVNDVVLVATEQVQSWDGTNLSENTLHFRPEIRKTAEDTAKDGNLNIGDEYHAQIVFVVEDNQGNIHRSAPSFDRSNFWDTPNSHTVLSSNTQIYVDYIIPPPSHFRPEYGQSIRVQLYMTEPNSPGPYYLVEEQEVSQSSTGAAFDKFLGRIFWDNLAISPDILKYQPVLYTTGGILENTPPPPLRSIVSTSRHVLGISSENPTQIWVSKPVVGGIAPEWNPALTVSTTTDEEFVGMAALDDNIVVTTKDSVYLLSGEGPGASGTKNFAGPTPIPSDSGCVNRRTLVTGPFGILFQGRRGFYIVTRGLTVEYIGAPEDTVKDLDIKAAVVVPDQQEVRFTTASGTGLVYNYARNQWSTRAEAGAHAAMIDNVYHVLRNTAGGYAVIKEREDSDLSFQEVSTGGLENTMQITTGWIHVRNLQDFYRIRRVVLTGEYINEDVTVKFAYDHDDTWIDTYNFGTLSSSGAFRLRLVPSRQKVSAIKIQITETHTSTLHTEGFYLNGISLEYAMKVGVNKNIPTAESL